MPDTERAELEVNLYSKSKMGARSRWVLDVTTHSLYNPERDSVPILQEAGRVSKPMWSVPENLILTAKYVSYEKTKN